MIVGFGRICEPCSRSFQESLNRTDWEMSTVHLLSNMRFQGYRLTIQVGLQKLIV